MDPSQWLARVRDGRSAHGVLPIAAIVLGALAIIVGIRCVEYPPIKVPVMAMTFLTDAAKTPLAIPWALSRLLSS